MSTRQIIKKKLAQYNPKIKDSFAVLGTTGDGTGTVATGEFGYVYARDLKGNVFVVWNTTVPNIAGLPVKVGMKDKRFQVLDLRDVYLTTVPKIPPHNYMHEFGASGTDMVRAYDMQVQPWKGDPDPNNSFTIIITRQVYNASGTWIDSSSESIDLTSDKPDTGGCYVLLSVDNVGTINKTVGSTVTPYTNLAVTDIPAIPYLQSPLWAVRLYDVQTQLNQAYGNNDFIDLRWSSAFSGGGSPSPSNTDGWIGAPGVWSYSSTDTPTYVMNVNVDVSGVIGVGCKIKLTNDGSEQHFIVTAVGSWSGSAIPITVFGGNLDNPQGIIVNSAITDVYYSFEKAPFGFAITPDLWTIETFDDEYRTQSSPEPGQWYNINGIYMWIPIGAWNITYEASVQGVSSSMFEAADIFMTLSVYNNAQENINYSIYATQYGASGGSTGMGIGLAVNKQFFLSLSSKTVYYLLERTSFSEAINLFGQYMPTRIKAVCAYL